MLGLIFLAAHLGDRSQLITIANSFVSDANEPFAHSETGYKYVVQLVNGTSSNIPLGTTGTSDIGYRLRFCMNYQKTYDSGAFQTNDYDYDLYIDSNSINNIASGASIYLGWNINGVIPNDTSITTTYTALGSGTTRSSQVYLPFMVDTHNGSSVNNVLADVRILLFKTTNGGTNWGVGVLQDANDIAGASNDTGVTIPTDYYASDFATGTINADYFTQGKTTSGVIGRIMGATDPTGITDGIAGIGPGISGSLKRSIDKDAPSTSYTATDWNTASGAFLSTSAMGDPHITTLNGENYKFDYLGAFRLLEHTVNNNKLIINGLSETGEGRWHDKQYIKKIYINYNGKDILLDTGFRGSPVHILNNNGIKFIEKTLDFDQDARRYSVTGKGVGARGGVSKDSDEPVTDDLPELIRNQITILLNDQTSDLMPITIQNVNKYNLQPCRLFVNLNKDTLKNDKGCLIDRKYVNVSKLSSISDITELREPNENDLLNIPKLERDPKRINIQYQ